MKNKNISPCRNSSKIQ